MGWTELQRWVLAGVTIGALLIGLLMIPPSVYVQSGGAILDVVWVGRSVPPEITVGAASAETVVSGWDGPARVKDCGTGPRQVAGIFGNGLTSAIPYDVVLSRHGPDDVGLWWGDGDLYMVLKDCPPAHAVILAGAFDPFSGIQSITFPDGTRWSTNDVLLQALWSGLLPDPLP